MNGEVKRRCARTTRDVRTQESCRKNTGPGRLAWPRLRETERLRRRRGAQRAGRQRGGP